MKRRHQTLEQVVLISLWVQGEWYDRWLQANRQAVRRLEWAELWGGGPEEIREASERRQTFASIFLSADQATRPAGPLEVERLIAAAEIKARELLQTRTDAGFWLLQEWRKVELNASFSVIS